MTTGMPRWTALATGTASALSSSGARTMPDTPRLTKPSTSDTCESRSSSRSGPRHTMSTFWSAAAFAAPAWMLCQNTCEVPLGITAIVVRPASRLPPHATVASSARTAPALMSFSIGFAP